MLLTVMHLLFCPCGAVRKDGDDDEKWFLCRIDRIGCGIEVYGALAEEVGRPSQVLWY
eukprot:SAG11_NODE_1531_length_4736_cov_2.690317_4_plen_58_part_00